MSNNNRENQTNIRLQELREEIDDIDSTLLTLINQRAAIAQKVGHVKLAQSTTALFYRPEREAKILRSIMARNTGPLANAEIGRLFREIISSCLALEKNLEIAFLGPTGTFTEQAALKHFGQSAHCVAMPTIADVFREVEGGLVDYGVVPVENSSEGVVSHTLDLFRNCSVHICGEAVLPIHHHLLCHTQADTTKITRICAHQQALGQCSRWLDSHWPNVERMTVSSNAEAARMAAQSMDCAAIAGATAADLYGLKKLACRIEDTCDNATRFLVIGRQQVAASGEDKTSVMVSMPNKPGSLHQLLTPFSCHNIDLSRVESRPARDQAWRYVFFIDFIGHRDEPQIQSVLAEIEQFAVQLKVLGSYPQGPL